MRIKYDETEQPLAFLRKQDPETAHQIRAEVLLLSLDPAVDNERKKLLLLREGTFPLYLGDRWWILYEVVREGDGEETLHVKLIGPATPGPSSRP